MHIVISGGSRGIGLEFAKQYVEKNHQVSILCRKTNSNLLNLKQKSSEKVSIFENFDVRETASWQDCLSFFASNPIDILINNAAIMIVQDLGDLTRDAILEQFMVNALAPLMLSNALLPFMNKPSRIAMITSRMGSIEDNTSGGSYGYRMSKSALNSASKSLAIDLKSQEIAVGIFHPGYVKTDMTGGSGHLTTQESVAGLIPCIDGLNLQNSGSFWHQDGSNLPW